MTPVSLNTSEVHLVAAATYGAAKRAGLHLSCGHDDAALTTTDCILDNVGEHLLYHCMKTVKGLLFYIVARGCLADTGCWQHILNGN